MAEKEGFIKGLENTNFEKINWSSVGMLCGGLDLSILKSIIFHIIENMNNVITSNGKSSDEIIH